MIDKGAKLSLEIIQAFRPIERLIESKKRDDGARLQLNKPFIGIRIMTDSMMGLFVRMEFLRPGKSPLRLSRGMSTETRRVRR